MLRFSTSRDHHPDGGDEEGTRAGEPPGGSEAHQAAIQHRSPRFQRKAGTPITKRCNQAAKTNQAPMPTATANSVAASVPAG